MLSKDDQKDLIKLIKKLARQSKAGLPKDVFEALAKVVSYCALEIIVANKNKELLLTWRDDKFWKGWHFPGGILRFGESFEHCLERLAVRELGTGIKTPRFLFPVNYGLVGRGHDIGLVFLCRTKTKPKHGKFFAKMPKDIIRQHKSVWREIMKEIKA